MTSLRPPHGMDTGDAPSSFEVGTDGGFYAGQTPTDAGSPRDRGGHARWMVLVGSTVLTAALVGGGLWGLGIGASDAPGPGPGPVASPAPVAPAPTVLDEGLRALARINARAQAQRLSWGQRHELLQQLSTGPHAARVDRRLHLALDLLHAGQAEAPCEAFAAALDRVQADLDPYFADALSSARAPGQACSELDARREALHRGLVAPGEEPAGKGADTSEASTGDRERSRSSRRPRKPKRSSAAAHGATTETKPKPVAKPLPKVGGKLDDELRPFGK